MFRITITLKGSSSCCRLGLQLLVLLLAPTVGAICNWDFCENVGQHSSEEEKTKNVKYVKRMGLTTNEQRRRNLFSSWTFQAIWKLASLLSCDRCSWRCCSLVGVPACGSYRKMERKARSGVVDFRYFLFNFRVWFRLWGSFCYPDDDRRDDGVNEIKRTRMNITWGITEIKMKTRTRVNMKRLKHTVKKGMKAFT